MTERTVPNLPSRDFAATVAFYGAFGFTVTHRSDEWLVLRRGTLELEFFRFPDLAPEDSSFMCSIRVDDVDELYRAIAAAGVVEASTGRPRLLPVRPQPWGQRAGFLVDPDGSQLHLIQNGPTPESAPA
ncbi:bleomycin resistance protein [Microbacterium sp. cx-55]|uniref:bleomycin resistance protein n=1 Tax=unclassified Microbacterium TaxID=2609290 RepID=UPI001CBC36A0|nr:MULTISPECIES: bleomycin resistance protein [unclassified Microbacterium]MBZ4486072.1 bleomycin resistance protein [Microbacterium sp. cx-55]MCC4907064.1 bleomycin resistance protein [Microbacterium sp. cx-59]UGB34057.1 bleomycin resistance protein [Microbacterium sp. cx-55]